MKDLKKWLTYSLIVQIFLVWLSSFFPRWIEKYYSQGIYMGLSKVFRFTFGWIPFSFGDILYGLSIVLITRYIVLFISHKSFRNKTSIYSVGATVSIIYFLFYFLWGLNYSRENVYARLTLDEKELNEIQLLELSEFILNETSKTLNKIVEIDSLPVVIHYTKNQIFDIVPGGYENLQNRIPDLDYRPISLKKSLISLPLTYMGFSGYLNPFTGEAQVDYLVPKVSLPIICLHEMAHQMGVGFESEANFIGFLAAYYHDDPYIKYSGLLMAYRYSLFDLYIANPEKAQDLLARTPKGIIKNIEEMELFWAKYQNASEAYFKAFYDGYLKVNNQEDGMKSYSNMTKLLIAYKEKYGL
ncbi:DUF3810 domain-containing protein [Namhaeicola litoreus]|uniref:DUF3810 domain-containing protein n=1 Tax=Namhaeicola litoreus TaxID=1052145 RepID=A0ABW3Y5F8_9FLAO